MQTKGLYWVGAGLLLGLTAGCREPNPAYVANPSPRDAAPHLDVVPDGLAEDGVPDVVLPPADAVDAAREVLPPPFDGPPPRGDLPPPDENDEDAALDAADARDARDTRRPGDDLPEVRSGDDGPRDAADVPLPVDGHDGPPVSLDGGLDTGPVDTAPVDAPPLCAEGHTRSCSHPDNPLVGACHAGTETCAGGVWGLCQGEVTPGAETCGNRVDDDCNGMTDDGCIEDCVVVAADAEVATADGTAAHPFPTVEAGLAAALVVDGGSPRRVCVAGGATCADARTYTLSTGLDIPNGAVVQGNYAWDGATLSYCGGTEPPITALQFEVAGASVMFSSDVTARTELGGFVIGRAAVGSSAGTVGPITAVSVNGGTNVTLSEIFVTDAVAGQTTYGIDVESGGQVTITRSSIGGGSGQLAAVGVYVNLGSVTLRDNCDAVIRGTCATACSGNQVRGFQGRVAAGSVSDGSSSAVYLTTDASASSVVANTLCAGPGGGTAESMGANVAALRCEGGACAEIAGNELGGGTGRVSVALGLASGGGHVASNAIRTACGSAESTGVVLRRATALLENNRVFAPTCAGGIAGSAFYGVRLVLGATGTGPDLSSNVIDPGGASGECQSVGVEVSGAQGETGVAPTLRNNIVVAGVCRRPVAVLEQPSATAGLLENNDLCASPAADSSVPAAVLLRRGGSDATTIDAVNGAQGARGNLSKAPEFVAYPDDFHLTALSPCIDQGTAAGAPATDADGVSRPQGAGYDIGAYEFVSPSPPATVGGSP